MLNACGEAAIDLYLVVVLVCLVHLRRAALVQLGLLLGRERVEHGLVQCDDRLVHEGGHGHGRPLGVLLANALEIESISRCCSIRMNAASLAHQLGDGRESQALARAELGDDHAAVLRVVELFLGREVHGADVRVQRPQRHRRDDAHALVCGHVQLKLHRAVGAVLVTVAVLQASKR